MTSRFDKHYEVAADSSLDAVFKEIRSGAHKDTIARIAKLPRGKKDGTPEEVAQYKARRKVKEGLPAFTPSATIKIGCTHGETSMVAHTGCMSLDFDEFKTVGEREAVFKLMRDDAHTNKIFRSPGGLGLKWFGHMDGLTKDNHKDAWACAAAYAEGAGWGVADDNADNVTRLCYIGHDPGAYEVDDMVGSVPLAWAPAAATRVVRAAAVGAKTGEQLLDGIGCVYAPEQKREARSLLAYIDASERSIWRDVAWIIHRIVGEAGFKVFNDWAETAPPEEVDTTNREIFDSYDPNKDKLMGLTRLRELAGVVKDVPSGWYDDFVFSAEGGEFVSIARNVSMNATTFDSLNLSYLFTESMKKQGKLGPPQTPSKYVMAGALIPKVQGVRYAPGEEMIFDLDGAQYLNTYKAPGAAVLRANWTDADAVAVGRVQEHFKRVFHDNERVFMEQWCAWLYRKPSKRVSYCPLLIGAGGIGKTSIFEVMMKNVLGTHNFSSVDTETLFGLSTLWTNKSQLVSVEELYDPEHKRNPALRLMIFISNAVCPLKRLGLDPVDVMNVTSYVACTNYPDAIALDASDRRWYPFVVKPNSKEAFIRDCGGMKGYVEYHNELRRAFTEHTAAIRGWLTELDLAGFNNSTPPYSEELKNMAEGSKTDVRSAIEGLVHAGTGTVNADMVELVTLRAQLLAMSIEDVGCLGKGGVPGPRVCTRMLRGMGFVSAGQHTMGSFEGREGRVQSTWLVLRKYQKWVQKEGGEALRHLSELR